MPYDSQHWNWGAGFCELHRGQDLPCKVCVETKAPGLFGSAEPIEPSFPEGEAVPLMDDANREIGFSIRGAVSGRMSSGQPNPAPDNLSKEQMRELRRRADASMREVSESIDLDLFERVLSEYGKVESAKSIGIESISRERIENPDGSVTERHRWKLGDKPRFTASLLTMTGQRVEVPVDPNDFYAGMMIQIAQERKYTFEQFQANRRDLRVAAKNRMFGDLYSDSFINELQASYQIQDETSVFKRKDIDALRRMNDKVLVGTRLEIAVENLLFREPPRLSSSETEFYDQVRANGIVEPLWVRQLTAFDFEVLNGARRLNAAKVLKLKTVPCIVLNGSMRTAAKSGSFATNMLIKKMGIIASKEIADLGKYLGVNPCDEIFLTDTDK